MATNDVRDILDMGAVDQGRGGQQVDPAKPTKESIMNPFKVNHYQSYMMYTYQRVVYLGTFVALCSIVRVCVLEREIFPFSGFCDTFLTNSLRFRVVSVTTERIFGMRR